MHSILNISPLKQIVIRIMKEMWNERYGQEYIYGKKPNDFLSATINKPGKGKVMCLAEGQGRNAVYLAGLGYDVTAIDYSEEGLKKANKLANEAGVKITTIQMDLDELICKQNEWDGIISIYGHLPDALRIKVHKEVIKGLKTGGFLLIEAYNINQLNYNSGGPKSIELLYSLKKLESDFSNHFYFKIFRETEREVNEGSFHKGLASVIQVHGIRK